MIKSIHDIILTIYVAAHSACTQMVAPKCHPDPAERYATVEDMSPRRTRKQRQQLQKPDGALFKLATFFSKTYSKSQYFIAATVVVRTNGEAAEAARSQRAPGGCTKKSPVAHRNLFGPASTTSAEVQSRPDSSHLVVVDGGADVAISKHNALLNFFVGWPMPMNEPVV